MERCVGVILSVLAFRESDQIATVFTPGGILKFFIKRKRSPALSVLVEGEFVYALGKGDMHRFCDGTILQQNLRLRERLENLEAAGKLVQAIQKSQMPGKAAPRLYQLFCYFLRMIPEVERPLDLASIFLIKTLKHEGLSSRWRGVRHANRLQRLGTLESVFAANMLQKGLLSFPQKRKNCFSI